MVGAAFYVLQTLHMLHILKWKWPLGRGWMKKKKGCFGVLMLQFHTLWPDGAKFSGTYGRLGLKNLMGGLKNATEVALCSPVHLNSLEPCTHQKVGV